MAFGDNITSLGTQVSPDNSGGSCVLAISIPANSACIVFGLVCQGTVGTTNADISDSESLSWTPLKDGTDKLLVEASDTIGKSIFGWYFNNETGSVINTTVTLARGSPGTNAAGRSFSLSVVSFDGVMSSPTNYSGGSSATGDPAPSLGDLVGTGNMAVACYLSVGPNQMILSTPSDMTRVALHNTYPSQRQADVQAALSWGNYTAAWSTNDAGAVAFVFGAEDAGGGLSPITAELDVVLANASLSSTSVLLLESSLDESLGGSALVSESSLLLSSGFSASLDGLLLTGSVDVLISSELSQTLESTLLSSAGTLFLPSSVGIETEGANLTSSGVLPLEAGLNRVFDPLLLVALGSLGNVLTGELSVAFSDMSFSSVATLPVTSGVAVELDPTQVNATSVLVLEGFSTLLFDGVLVSSSATLSVEAVSSGLFGPLSLTSSTTLTVEGILDEVFDPLLLTSSASALEYPSSRISVTYQGVRARASGFTRIASTDRSGRRT